MTLGLENSDPYGPEHPDDIHDPRYHGRYGMIGRFKLHDRVRVKFGVDRGHYGTITHVGGDLGNYYGVKLDAADKDVGYSDYELDAA